MRSTVSIILCAATWLLPCGAISQPTVQSPRDLALTINRGDHVRVYRDGSERLTGEVRAVRHDSITLAHGYSNLTQSLSTVRLVRVDVERSRRRQGILIGALAGVVGGFLIPCDDPDCEDAPLMLGILGGGLGALVAPPRVATVFVRSSSQPPVTAQSDPPGSLDAVAEYVNLGDQILVSDQSGRSVSGRLERMNGTTLVVQTDDGIRTFEENTVRKVAGQRWSYGRGALIGGALFLACASTTCSKGIHSGVGPTIGGAIIGAIIGAAIPHMATVYVAPAPRRSAHRASTDRLQWCVGATWAWR